MEKQKKMVEETINVPLAKDPLETINEIRTVLYKKTKDIFLEHRKIKKFYKKYLFDGKVLLKLGLKTIQTSKKGNKTIITQEKNRNLFRVAFLTLVKILLGEIKLVDKLANYYIALYKKLDDLFSEFMHNSQTFNTKLREYTKSVEMANCQEAKLRIYSFLVDVLDLKDVIYLIDLKNFTKSCEALTDFKNQWINDNTDKEVVRLADKMNRGNLGEKELKKGVKALISKAVEKLEKKSANLY